MFAIGDIVEIFAPTVGYKKYHLCVLEGADGVAYQFLYLNSEPGYAGSYAVDCAEVPCLAPSNTGKTVFSFSMVPRYSERQLKLYRAKKKGVLASALAEKLLQHAKQVKTLTGSEKAIVLAALKLIAKS